MGQRGPGFSWSGNECTGKALIFSSIGSITRHFDGVWIAALEAAKLQHKFLINSRLLTGIHEAIVLEVLSVSNDKTLYR